MPRIVCKDLSQKRFEVDVGDNDTVAEFKSKAAATMTPQPDIANVKVIYSGKILADEKRIADVGIKEKDFVVVMVSKPKAAPAAAAPAPAPPAASTAEAPSAPAAAPASETPATSAAAPTPAAPAATGQSDGTGFLTGTALDGATSELMQLGYSQAQVQRALRDAFNNPDRAAEFLFSGRYDGQSAEALNAPAPGATPAASTGSEATATPAAAPANSRNLFQQAAQAASGGGAQTGSGNDTASAAAAAAGGQGSELEFLRNNPMFAQLRQIVQTNPAMLQPFLQQLGQSNPGLMQIIARNQAAFLQLLQGDEGDLEGGEAGEGGAQYIEVSAEEQAAINRLVELGFDRNLAIQAFIACDRNEELAANWLFENGNDFGDD